MEITLKLGSILRRHTENSKGVVKLNLAEGTTVGEVIKSFDMIEGEAGIIIVNSKLESEDTVLNSNDILELYPVLGGG